MKKTFILFLVFSSIMACDLMNKKALESEAINNFSKNEEIEEVRRLISDSFQDIWSDLDSTKIKQHHTDDFMLLENGIVWNNDSVRAYLNRERLEMEAYEYKRLNQFDFLRVVYNHSSIWIAYDNYGIWVKGNDTLFKVHWLESAIAIKKKDKWKLQQLHSTTVRK